MSPDQAPFFIVFRLMFDCVYLMFVYLETLSDPCDVGDNTARRPGAGAEGAEGRRNRDVRDGRSCAVGASIIPSIHLYGQWQFFFLGGGQYLPITCR